MSNISIEAINAIKAAEQAAIIAAQKDAEPKFCIFAYRTDVAYDALEASDAAFAAEDVALDAIEDELGHEASLEAMDAIENGTVDEFIKKYSA